MTTTATPTVPPAGQVHDTAAPPRPTRATTTVGEARGAVLAGRSMLAAVLLAVPATIALGTAPAPGATVTRLVGAAFVAVAVLEVVAGWGLHLLLRRRATPASTAALVSRCGYAVLLLGSAAVLTWPGGAGAAGFARDWSVALVVLGLHLAITGTTLWRTRTAPLAVALVVAAAGTGYLLDDALASWTGADHTTVLLPLALGEAVLAAWLLGSRVRRPSRG